MIVQPQQYLERARTNEIRGQFEQQVKASMDFASSAGIELLIDQGSGLYPDRIVFLNSYPTADNYDVIGCSCCFNPDFLLHFTRTISTDIGAVQVYLRTLDWFKQATTDEQFRHTMAKSGDFYDLGESVRRLPNLIRFYELQGVPKSLLERVNDEIKNMINQEKERIE